MAVIVVAKYLVDINVLALLQFVGDVEMVLSILINNVIHQVLLAQLPAKTKLLSVVIANFVRMYKKSVIHLNLGKVVHLPAKFKLVINAHPQVLRAAGNVEMKS